VHILILTITLEAIFMFSSSKWIFSILIPNKTSFNNRVRKRVHLSTLKKTEILKGDLFATLYKAKEVDRNACSRCIVGKIWLAKIHVPRKGFAFSIVFV